MPCELAPPKPCSSPLGICFAPLIDSCTDSWSAGLPGLPKGLGEDGETRSALSRQHWQGFYIALLAGAAASGHMLHCGLETGLQNHQHTF
jgi:hypothetical protein